MRPHFAFLLAAHGVALYALVAAFSWEGLFLALGLQFLFGCLGITLTYHRALTHRALVLAPGVEHLFSLFGLLAIQGDPIEWVAIHRQHHRFSDTPRDPHDASRGFWFAHALWIEGNYFRFLTPAHLEEYAGDLLARPWYRALRALQLPLVLGFVYGLYALGGWPWVLWGFFVRLVVGDHCTWLVNSAGHTFGYRSYPRTDRSTNCLWTALVSFGEGWHNNHHQFPASAAHGLRPGEPDATWAMIRLLAALGLARDLRLPRPDQVAAGRPPRTLAERLGLAVPAELRFRPFLERYHPGVLTTPKTKKVLFVSPTTYQPDGTPFKAPKVQSPALTFPLLAALTPPHWEIELVFETAEEVPLDTDADLVAIGTMGHSLWRARDLAREFRDRGKYVVMGGTISSLVPETAREFCDTLLVGDAEGAWQAFLADFEAGRPQARYDEVGRHPIAALPVPRYDLLLGKPAVGPLVPVQVARGCPYRCQFCTINALSQGAYTPRPVEHIVRDIDAAYRYGARAFFFLDDNIAGDRDFARRLFESVRPLGIRWVGQSTFDILKEDDLLPLAVESGCLTLCFGMESLEQQSLNSVKKGFYRAHRYEEQIARIRASGLQQSAEFIIGMDHDTPESLDRLADFIVAQAIPLVRCYIYAPIPGTPVHAQMKAAGRLLDDDERIGGENVGFAPVHFTPEELQAAYWRLMDRIYSWPAILRRVFGRPSKSLVAALLTFAANLGYRRMVRARTVPGLC